MNRLSAQTLAALASGTVFGLGLALSGMLDPARVQGFLNVAGRWDPSLAFVLAGAVATLFVALRTIRRMRRPAFDTSFHLPENRRIDRRLILGSVVFGFGWGLAGFCPGPAVSAVTLGVVEPVLFVAAMAAGMVLHDRLAARGTA
ncbi:YeeE/YedE family protein [Rhizobium sp. TRM95111]|uniref:YeeE/YedE family protein n=1 Tax=Rhizobium alarense TaxID=2846851 RepID=UPI001F2DAEC0|nr:YeeE/YedE family protein [Rhizobium alarense]MCF3638592.1 YeeE/YedE family protein [Rhizobium alarense]